LSPLRIGSESPVPSADDYQMMTNRYNEYDDFAWAYNKMLGTESMQRFLPVVEQLVLSHCKEGASVLDLCCGTGQLARELNKRGYRVTGIDGSEAMLSYARENAPDVEFIADDARTFCQEPKCRAAISAYDSLNHVMSIGELGQVFRNVHASLVDGGCFQMDLNMEEGYKARWRGPTHVIDGDYAVLFGHCYDEKTKIGTVPLTVFRLFDGQWTRSDATLTQRCYTREEITTSLKAAGFVSVETYDAEKDLKLPGGIGRMFFLSRKG